MQTPNNFNRLNPASEASSTSFLEDPKGQSSFDYTMFSPVLTGSSSLWEGVESSRMYMDNDAARTTQSSYDSQRSYRLTLVDALYGLLFGPKGAQRRQTSQVAFMFSTLFGLVDAFTIDPLDIMIVVSFVITLMIGVLSALLIYKFIVWSKLYQELNNWVQIAACLYYIKSHEYVLTLNKYLVAMFTFLMLVGTLMAFSASFSFVSFELGNIRSSIVLFFIAVMSSFATFATISQIIMASMMTERLKNKYHNTMLLYTQLVNDAPYATTEVKDGKLIYIAPLQSANATFIADVDNKFDFVKSLFIKDTTPIIASPNHSTVIWNTSTVYHLPPFLGSFMSVGGEQFARYCVKHNLREVVSYMMFGKGPYMKAYGHKFLPDVINAANALLTTKLSANTTPMDMRSLAKNAYDNAVRKFLIEDYDARMFLLHYFLQQDLYFLVPLIAHERSTFNDFVARFQSLAVPPPPSAPNAKKSTYVHNIITNHFSAFVVWASKTMRVALKAIKAAPSIRLTNKAGYEKLDEDLESEDSIRFVQLESGLGTEPSAPPPSLVENLKPLFGEPGMPLEEPHFDNASITSEKTEEIITEIKTPSEPKPIPKKFKLKLGYLRKSGLWSYLEKSIDIIPLLKIACISHRTLWVEELSSNKSFRVNLFYKRFNELIDYLNDPSLNKPKLYGQYIHFLDRFRDGTTANIVAVYLKRQSIEITSELFKYFPKDFIALAQLDLSVMAHTKEFKLAMEAYEVIFPHNKWDWSNRSAISDRTQSDTSSYIQGSKSNFSQQNTAASVRSNKNSNAKQTNSSSQIKTMPNASPQAQPSGPSGPVGPPNGAPRLAMLPPWIDEDEFDKMVDWWKQTIMGAKTAITNACEVEFMAYLEVYLQKVTLNHKAANVPAHEASIIKWKSNSITKTN